MAANSTDSTSKIFLIVGLGNPGPKYAATRHNIGFEFVDTLAEHWKAPVFAKKFQGLITQIDRSGVKVLLLKPQTFMNLSGQSVLEVLQFYKIDPSMQLLVVTDDLDLAPAQLRLRLFGGTGGHNGLKSITEVLGSDKFARLRIGIGRPLGENYVLSKIPADEKAAYVESFQHAIPGVECILKDGLPKAMNVINVKRGITDES